MTQDTHTAFVYAREIQGIGVLAYYLLKLMGREIPKSVEIGENFELTHGGFRVGFHTWTIIVNRVKNILG